MAEERGDESVRILVAELGAALPARRAAVEYARHFDGGKDRDLAGAMQALRGEEVRFAASAEVPGENLALLARLAVREAEALEEEAARLEAWLRPDAPGSDAHRARLTAGLLWEARYGEGRARASLTARRRRERLPGFEDALDLAPENELLFLALRRFSRLLHGGKDWPKADLDWLRLRATTLPGRLRLHAAELRGLAESAAGMPVPESMLEARRPFLQFGYEPAAALAWAVAGFTLSEALLWGAAGQPWAAQALAWRAWGHGPTEAAAWAALDLLPDEAAAFKACGVSLPLTARQLRQALGDVEHLLAWHRAGFDTAEILRLRADGVTDVDKALRERGAAAPARVLEAPLALEEPLVPRVGLASAAAELMPEPVLKPKAGAPSARIVREEPVARPAAAPLPDWGPEGGAWIGWGVFEPAGGELERPRKLTRSRALGDGLLDVVNASEAVALLSLPAGVPPLAVDPDWQAQLDWHRQAAGRGAAPGEWLLAGLPPCKALLYWGLVFKSSVSPWGSALDFDPAETWSQRWKRRCDEWGQPDLACPCRVGRTPGGGWMVEVPGTRVEHGGGAPLRLERTAPEPAWKEAVDAFTLTMGLGKSAPGWVLVVGD